MIIAIKRNNFFIRLGFWFVKGKIQKKKIIYKKTGIRIPKKISKTHLLIGTPPCKASPQPPHAGKTPSNQSFTNFKSYNYGNY
jgi:hypothetical protein